MHMAGRTQLGIFTLLGALLISHSGRIEAAPSQPWLAVIDWSKSTHKAIVEEMKVLIDEVKVRCTANELRRCTELTPPKQQPTGYGLLPTLKRDAAESTRGPYTTTYSLEKLTERLSAARRDLELLKASSSVPGTKQDGVDEFIRLRKALDNLDEHIKYHAYWQRAAVDHKRWYGKRRPLADKAQAMMTTWRAKSQTRHADRAELVSLLSPFKPSKAGIRCVRGEKDALTLTVTVTTDVPQGDLTQAFVNTVEERYTGRSSTTTLLVDVILRHVSAESLFKGSPPEPGSRIDEEKHRARFSADTLVLTTGASAHHAFTGRSIHLGSGAVTRRQLAHEAGHLLGFSDVYLRHFIPHEHPRYGVIFTEWAGLQPDIMGNSRGGEVTTALRDRLIQGYCSPR